MNSTLALILGQSVKVQSHHRATKETCIFVKQELCGASC